MNEVVGSFEDIGELTAPDAVIGEYENVAPDNSDNYNIGSNYGGYASQAPQPYDIEFINREGGRGLVIVDMQISGNAPLNNIYYNIMDTVKNIDFPDDGVNVEYGDNTVASMIRTLSCSKVLD